MSREAYFKKFPIISYDGVPSINLLRRTAFNEKVENFISAFYPLSLEDDTRIDHLAFDYYDTVDYDWLIYHMNGVIDPYYGTLLPSRVFEKHIKSKYESIRNAMRRVSHYENKRDTGEIKSISFLNSLPSSHLKYFQPLQNALTIIGYESTSEIFKASTNMIRSVQLTESNDNFADGEIISDKIDNTNYAEVLYTEGNVCMYQHVYGDFLNGVTLVGETSKVERTAAADSTLVQNVIPEDEQVYYRPVSFYEIETNKNEEKREIFLIDKLYSERLNTELENLLK